MSLRYRGRTVEDKTDQEFVLLRNGKVMTFVAIEIFMFTCSPGIVGRLHEVAADTKFRIVLGEVIEFKSNNAAADKHGEKKDG